MKIHEVTEPVGLKEERHFVVKELKTPVIQSELYTTLGRRLFELYEKYKIEKSEQREIERLSYLLMSFTISRADAPKKSFWQKVKSSLWN